MRRRDFILGVGSAAAWPSIALAQLALPVIGFIDPRSPEALTERLRGFRQGLKRAVTSKARTLPSCIVGPRMILIDFLRCWRNWLTDQQR
jgi:hypothetical protein